MNKTVKLVLLHKNEEHFVLKIMQVFTHYIKES